MIFHQASKYVQDLSFHMTVGWEHSLEAKRIPHSGHSPYGIDKLFLDSKGNALYIVRDLPDRSRVKLDPKSQTEIEIFPKGMAGPIRQPTERIVLVPGDPLRVEVVRSIFRRHFVDGWKEYRIAKELNDRGTPSKFRVHPVEA
jgi:hypothetical protein